MIAEATRKVLLLIVDGLSWRVVQPAVREGRLGFFAELARAGAIQPCVSIFPSITPAATASLVTGAAPRGHGIQGAFWYDARREGIEYFGDAPRVILREGVDEFFDDYLRKLNDDLLESDTLFEMTQSQGKTAAGLNLMWRRGKTRHAVDTPGLLKLLPGVELADEVAGPDWLFLGDFVASQLPGTGPIRTAGGPTHRFGFNDGVTIDRLSQLLRSDAEPDLTVAYFPDNDFRSHASGAEGALSGLVELDKQLGEIAETQGGVGAWLETTAIVVVGDHGHDDLVSEAADRIIDLGELLGSWRLTAPGADGRPDDELLVCPNMRAAQINLSPQQPSECRRVIDQLLSDRRVDQTIEPAEGVGLTIRTNDRGSLTFGPWGESSDADPDAQRVVDPLGKAWSVRGTLEAVDAHLSGQDAIAYGEYPDALGRLWAGSPGRQDAVWVTARPGHEFAIKGTTTHQAGSHGSLHRCDSETVLITAGLTPGVERPENASITDITGLCLASLGLESAGHAAAAAPGS